MMGGKPFDDGLHKIEQFWNKHEEKVENRLEISEEQLNKEAEILILKEKMRRHLETFLATEVLGWEDHEYGWFAPEFEICLYAKGQSSRFSENWIPTVILDQAMFIWDKMNLAANITFDPNEDGDYRYVIELKVDHSTGWGNTLQEAICNVVAARHNWRYVEEEDDTA